MNKAFKPKVSVVTPSFNQGNFIEQTILSVLNQDYSNIEYIVIDGGSKDSTVDVIKKYERKIKYWISEKDNGQTDAINKGLKLATGDILCYLNSDDLLLPGAISFVVDLFQERPEVDIIYGCTKMVDQNRNILLERHDNDFDFSMLLYGINYIQQPSTFWKLRVTQAIGYFDESLHYNMDYEYWLRAAYNKNRFKYVDVFLSEYRLHLSSKSVMNSKDIYKERRLIRRKYSKIPFYNYLDGLFFPILNGVFRIKRQVVKILKHGHVELVPGKFLYWYFKKIKKQYKGS